MLPLPATSPVAFLALAAAGVLVVALVARGFQRIGLTLFETALLGVSPLLTTLDTDLFRLEGALLAVNVAGFLVPFLISAKVVLEGRAPLVGTIVATGVVGAVAFVASYPVPGRGVLLHYQAPALAACAVALVVARSRFDQAGPVAFTSGAMGVILGADVLHLGALLDAGPVDRVVLGGAGVLDGIFLVALLGTLLALIATTAWTLVEKHATRLARRPAPEPAVEFLPLAAREANRDAR